jgi:hypothetical protein
MASFPATGYLSDNARTKGEMKTAFEAFLAKCKALMGGITLTEFTIASGSITPTTASITIDTEANAASDDLTNIVTTHHDAGSIITVRNEDAARVVTLKNGAGGAGQMFLRDLADCVLSGTTQWVQLIRVGADWYEVCRQEIQATTALRGIGKTASQGVMDALSSITDFVTPSVLAKHTPVGTRKFPVPASSFEAATTNGATVGKIETTTNAIGVGTVWDFDPTTGKFIWFKMKLPKGIDISAGFKFKVSWTPASGSGGVAWTCQALCRSDDDALDTAYGTAITVTDTLLLANDNHVTTLSATVTPSGTPAAEDDIFIRIGRDPANGSDTLAVNARLISVEFEFTQSKGNDS